jgi:hypothetical protein
MLKRAIKWAARPLWARLQGRIEIQIDQRLRALGYEVPRPPPPPPAAPAPPPPPAQPALFVPPAPPLWKTGGPFMAYSTCSSADLMHPQYARLCSSIDYAPLYHRKVWEWAYVIHHLEQAGVLAPGKRGLGFGVGIERLPALFAARGAHVVATDAPEELGRERGWQDTKEHSSSLDQLRYPQIVDDELFSQRVTHRACDMTAIPDDLVDFDFNWSSCCFEHLGSIEAGMQFMIDCVEKTLKVGGVAVHTTEFNLSSNDATVEEGDTVLFRLRDMEEIVERLRARGHQVQPIDVAPDSHYLDGFVDVPPYTHNPHLKLKLLGYVATSVGIVVTRGR